MKLSPEQVSEYRDAGYLVIQEFFSPDEIAALAAAADEWAVKAEGRTPPPSVFEFEQDDGGERPLLRRIINPAELDRRFEQVALSDRILDLVEALIGPNIQYHHGKLNYKPGLRGSAVEWHQDLSFIPHTNSDLLAVMTYIDDSTESNGCLTVIPGSHKLGPLDHFADDVFVGMVTRDLARVNLDAAVKISVRAGGLSIHHCLTLHRSDPNFSTRPRRVLINQYRAADSAELTPGVNHAYPYGRLLRGQDLGIIRLEPFVFRLPTDSSGHSAFTLQEEYKRSQPAQGS